MNPYEQMKNDLPTMYLRLMRNDSKVRCTASGPTLAVASGVLLDLINANAEEAEVVEAEVVEAEVVEAEVVEAADVEPADVEPVAKAPRKPRTKKTDVEPKDKAPRKSRTKKTDPDNFPL